MNCPTCGQQVDQNNRWKNTTTHQQSTTLALPTTLPSAAVASAYRRTPYRTMELIADVIVPLLQAIITGFLTAIIASISLSFLVKGLPWYSGMVVGMIVTGLAWGMFLGSSKDTLWIIEEITGRDIDGDGYTGQPSAPVRKWETNSQIVDKQTGARERLSIYEIEPEALQQFCYAVTNGQPFTEDTADKCGITQGQFNTWRDDLLSQNQVAWKNPNYHNAGLKLSPSFKIHLSGIAQTPLPDDLDS